MRRHHRALAGVYGYKPRPRCFSALPMPHATIACSVRSTAGSDLAYNTTELWQFYAHCPGNKQLCLDNRRMSSALKDFGQEWSPRFRGSEKDPSQMGRITSGTNDLNEAAAVSNAPRL